MIAGMSNPLRHTKSKTHWLMVSADVAAYRFYPLRCQ